MYSNIKPCDCGNETPAIWYQFNHGKQAVNVKCEKCGKIGKTSRSAKGAIKKWQKMLGN